MKQLQLLLTLAVCCALTSCFKDEPLNAEADIEQAWVSLENPGDLFFNKTDTLVNVVSTQTEIVFKTRNDDNLSEMAPEFRLTPGATVTPESGSVHDFSDGKAVQYTVTSQDGQWKRVYNVKFSPYYLLTHFSFENYHINSEEKNYYIWTETGKDGAQEEYWASGNDGFYMTNASAKPNEYPTCVSDDAVSGKSVVLTTRSTGFLGSLVGMPIAAGNIFIGTFDIYGSLTNALKGTLFGRPFNGKPLKFSGWYKYQPGEKITDKKGNIVEGVDKGDIYAVFYKNHDDKGNAVTLDGTNILTSSLIVAKAQLPEVKATDKWTSFEIEFVYSGDIDEEMLKNNGYSLAIVATSSIKGASFTGAVGSTLHIDEFEITCEGDQNN